MNKVQLKDAPIDTYVRHYTPFNSPTSQETRIEYWYVDGSRKQRYSEALKGTAVPIIAYGFRQEHVSTFTPNEGKECFAWGEAALVEVCKNKEEWMKDD